MNNDYLPPPMYDSSFPIYIEKQTYTHSGSLFPIHWHQQLELIYILEGDFFINMKNSQIEGRAGELLCINPNEIHHVQSNSENTEYYCVIIDPTFLASGVIDNCEQKVYTPLWSSSISFRSIIQSKEAKKFFLMIIEEFEAKREGYELAIKGYTHLIIANLYRSEMINADQQALISKTQPTHVREILNIIHHSYIEEISLSSLSQTLHLEPTYISHIFKKVTGTSVGVYIKKYRLKKAQHQLETTSNSIESIALTCGFNSTNYFSRAFKQQYNMSPNEYRKKSKETCS